MVGKGLGWYKRVRGNVYNVRTGHSRKLRTVCSRIRKTGSITGGGYPLAETWEISY